jgi:hypothetical protein
MAHPLRGFDDLVAYLTERRLPHVANPQTRSIEAPVKAPFLPGVVYLRWEQKAPVVQIIQAVCTSVPAERVADVEAACARVNTAAVVPGVGFDHALGTVYYRLAAPRYDGVVTGEQVEAQVHVCLANARDLHAPFTDVIAGQPGADILRLCAQHLAAAPKPAG